MYRKFYGLSRLPFRVTPELDLFYSLAERENILDALFYSIDRGDPVIKVVGESGCGKTMLLRLLMNRLQETGLKLIYIASPNVSFKGVLFYMCRELKIKTNGDEDKFEVIEMIKQNLIQLNSKKNRVVMLIDEAQSMPVDTLEELRLLTNLETGENELLQIVFFAQLEFDKTLNSHLLRQLKNRVAYAVNVRSLNKKEVKKYLNYRMQRAGYEGKEVFSQGTANIIHDVTKGIPRGINLVADKLLISSYGEGHVTILPKHFISMGISYFYVYKKIVMLFIAIVLSTSTFALLNFYKGTNYSFSKLLQEKSYTAKKESMLHGKNLVTGLVPALNFNKLVKTIGLKDKKSQKFFLSFYEETLTRLPGLLESKYTLQLMRGNLSKVNKAYNILSSQFSERELKNLFVVLLLKPNIDDAEYIFVYKSSDVRTRMYKVAENLPNSIKKSRPFLITTGKIRKIINDNATVLF